MHKHMILRYIVCSFYKISILGILIIMYWAVQSNMKFLRLEQLLVEYLLGRNAKTSKFLRLTYMISN